MAFRQDNVAAFRGTEAEAQGRGQGADIDAGMVAGSGLRGRSNAGFLRRTKVARRHSGQVFLTDNQYVILPERAVEIYHLFVIKLVAFNVGRFNGGMDGKEEKGRGRQRARYPCEVGTGA